MKQKREKQERQGIQKKQDSFPKVARRVSTVSILGNVILSFFKLLAGLLSHSSAMVSDAVHSASDVFSTVIVLIGIALAAKESDEDHPYGHERMECVAAIVLAWVLCLTGVWIGIGALRNILSGHYDTLTIPGVLALVAAIVSILAKEVMFWYTKLNAVKIDSSALMADAWHHRSDALSSVGALVGIAGARMGFPIMDSIASLVIFVFIVKAAYDIFMDAIDKMVDHSCDEQTRQKILDCVLANPQVIQVDLLQTRIFGNKIYVDIEIGIDGNVTLWEAHDIAQEVHDAIEETFPKVKHVMVHQNPVAVSGK